MKFWVECLVNISASSLELNENRLQIKSPLQQQLERTQYIVDHSQVSKQEWAHQEID